MSLRLRRGGGLVGAPGGGGGPVFGPTDGAAAVRAGAGPRTVTNPGGGISFNSSGSLQSAINANPSGSVFVCSVNNPVWNSTVNTGTKAPTIIMPGPVGQKVINGNASNIFAINAGPNTTIRGGTWRNFGNAGIIHGFITADDVTIEDAVISEMFIKGVDIQGHRVQLRYLNFLNNGVEGIGTGVSGTGLTNDLVIENCIFDGNNTRQNPPGDQGGAFKFGGVGNGLFRGNWVHDNIGFGAWWDTANYDWVIEENVCEKNYFSGLFFEANYGSVIRHNYVANNGRNIAIPPGAGNAAVVNQVNVRLSDNAAERTNPNGVVTPVQFTRNLVDHTDTLGGNTGALIMLWDHNDNPARHVANNDIFDNQFWLRTTTTNRIRAQDLDVEGAITTNFQLWDLDNHYFNNEYRVASTSVNYWSWDTGTGIGTEKSWTQWLTFHPTDGPRIVI